MSAKRTAVLTPLVVLGVWTVLDRGGAVIRRRAATRARPPEQSRLYRRGRRRVEAHLERRSDGRPFVLAVPVDGSRRSSLYEVDERRPWRDFERQAGLRRAAWGHCVDLSAGL